MNQEHKKGKKMKAVTNKLDWGAIARKIESDKNRINKYKNTDKEHLLNDIRFVKPYTLHNSDAGR